MQTLIKPGTITQDRAYIVFRFDELTDDVQERVLATRAEEPEYDYWGELLRDDIALDISEYWLPEHIAPSGATIAERAIPLMNGTSRREPDVQWDDYPWDVGFRASIDLETFILKHKLGRRFALLLSAWRRGEIYTANVGTDDLERRSPTADIDIAYDADETFAWESDGTWRPERKRTRRLEVQAAELETILLDWYHGITGQMAAAFSAQAEYYGSEEYYRNELSNDDMLYLADGTRSPYQG